MTQPDQPQMTQPQMTHSNMRCHDERCEVREQCTHWILRDDPGTPGAVAHHGWTLRPAWECNDEPCSHAEMTDDARVSE